MSVGSRPKIGELNGKTGKKRRSKYLGISGAADQVIVVYDQFIGFDGPLIGIYKPVVRHLMFGIKLGLGQAVCAVSRRRENLDDETRRPFDGPLCNNVAPIVGNEDEIRLDDGRGSKDEVCGRNKKLSKLVGNNIVGKKPVKVTQNCLMPCSGRWRHGKLSVKDLVTVTVIGQETVVVIGEDDLTLRNTLRKGRHNGTSFQLLTKQRVASRSSCQGGMT